MNDTGHRHEETKKARETPSRPTIVGPIIFLIVIVAGFALVASF